MSLDPIFNCRIFIYHQNINMGLPLTVRKNIKQVQPKIDSAIDTIKANLGLDSLTFEPDFTVIYDRAKLLNDGRDQTIGDIVTYYLDGLVNNTQKFKDDEMTQEAVQDAVGKAPKLVIAISPDEFLYVRSKLSEGEIKIEICDRTFPSNADSAGEDLESLL